jgi:hypothetical protein
MRRERVDDLLRKDASTHGGGLGQTMGHSSRNCWSDDSGGTSEFLLFENDSQHRRWSSMVRSSCPVDNPICDLQETVRTRCEPTEKTMVSLCAMLLDVVYLVQFHRFDIDEAEREDHRSQEDMKWRLDSQSNEHSFDIHSSVVYSDTRDDIRVPSLPDWRAEKVQMNSSDVHFDVDLRSLPLFKLFFTFDHGFPRWPVEEDAFASSCG